MDNLVIIIPAYNEEANILELVAEWHKVVEKTGNNSLLVVINDGSTDCTKVILDKLKDKLKYLEVIHKDNEGHGAAIYSGYSYALSKKFKYIFQTDSDRQTIPEDFASFWEKKERFDAVMGTRFGRKDGFNRLMVTLVLRAILLVIFRKNNIDANVPFRLIKSDILREHFQRIPKKHFLTNIMLSVSILEMSHNVCWIPITFKVRQNGINSINFYKIAKLSFRAIRDFRSFKKLLAKQKKK